MQRMLSCAICLSVTLLHTTKAAGQNEVPFGRDTLVAPLTLNHLVLHFNFYHMGSDFPRIRGTNALREIVSVVRHSELKPAQIVILEVE